MLERVDLSEAVCGAAKMLEVVVSKKATLTLRLADDLPAVEADPGQLCQVIMNLIANASDALEDKPGEITVTTRVMRCTKADLTGAYLLDELPDGEYVALEVTDTGVGMTEQIKQSLFDPFFTTKLAGRGLGLAAVLGIVRGHKGTIQVESERGQGTTFRVLLPCLPTDQPAIAKPAPGPAAITGGSGTILVVDDDDQVRRLTGTLLEELGYTVVLAIDGVDALSQFRRLQGQVDCILLDLTMPRLDGIETMVELRRISPEVRVILSSGYAEQAVSERLSDPPAAFIQKPYSLEILAERVGQVIRH